MTFEEKRDLAFSEWCKQRMGGANAMEKRVWDDAYLAGHRDGEGNSLAPLCMRPGCESPCYAGGPYCSHACARAAEIRSGG